MAVPEAGTATPDNWVQVTIDATTIRRSTVDATTIRRGSDGGLLARHRTHKYLPARWQDQLGCRPLYWGHQQRSRGGNDETGAGYQQLKQLSGTTTGQERATSNVNP